MVELEIFLGNRVSTERTRGWEPLVQAGDHCLVVNQWDDEGYYDEHGVWWSAELMEQDDLARALIDDIEAARQQSFQSAALSAPFLTAPTLPRGYASMLPPVPELAQ